jgi:DNA (cytosine-5)-methyltransferase 1
MTQPLRYGSVCSGIEAASVAWEPLGWEPAWFCEIDPFASALLAHRFPGVPNYGDFTKLIDPAHPVHNTPIDILVGGTPCQDFSIAGLRAGIEGDRGSLTLEFCRLVGVLQPKWLVWENVPGVLSSDGGRALGALLGALAELRYGFAWRVLDAQYFGLAQRRKRVFVVGCAGGLASRAGAVLLEPESVRGDPPPRRKARKEAPADAGGRAAEPGGAVVAPPLTATNDPSRSPQSAEVTAQVAAVVETQMHNCVSAISFEPRYYNRDNKTGGKPSDIVTLTASASKVGYAAPHVATSDMPCVMHPPVSIQDARGMDKKQNGKGWSDDNVAYTVDAMATQGVAQPPISVRRLTPRECERLQGFPDDWTLIPYRKGESSDSNRYRSLGNSMAVPVMRWIGRRIQLVEEKP